MLIRTCVSIIFFLAILFLPWWVSLPVGFLLLLKYESFVEIVLGGLVIDLLYATPISYFFGFMYVSTVFALALFIIRYAIGESLFVRQRTI
jgi:hypothetical protein